MSNHGHVKWGPKGIIMNSSFEGGLVLSPMYDLEAMKKTAEEKKEKETSNGGEKEAKGKEAHGADGGSERGPLGERSGAV